MNLLRSLPDRWHCWWSSDFHALADARDENTELGREVERLVEVVRDACVRLDELAAENRLLRADRDDLLGLRSSNYPQRLIEGNE